jgi:hypothetical protein
VQEPPIVSCHLKDLEAVDETPLPPAREATMIIQAIRTVHRVESSGCTGWNCSMNVAAMHAGLLRDSSS